MKQKNDETNKKNKNNQHRQQSGVVATAKMPGLWIVTELPVNHQFPIEPTPIGTPKQQQQPKQQPRQQEQQPEMVEVRPTPMSSLFDYLKGY